MISRAGNNIASTVLRDSRFIYHMHRIVHHATILELECSVPFIQARVRDISRDLYASEFLDDARDLACLRYARVSELLTKNSSIY